MNPVSLQIVYKYQIKQKIYKKFFCNLYHNNKLFFKLQIVVKKKTIKITTNMLKKFSKMTSTFWKIAIF